MHISKPVFRAALDTNALLRTLGQVLSYRRRGSCDYPNIVMAIENGWFKIFVTPRVVSELEALIGREDKRWELYQELVDKHVIVVVEKVECCSSRVLSRCIEDLDKFLRDESDREIVRELLGYIESSTTLKRRSLDEIPLLFITEDTSHFTHDVASTLTRCLIEFIEFELQRKGAALPCGIHSLEFLDHAIGKVLEEIRRKVRTSKQ